MEGSHLLLQTTYKLEKRDHYHREQENLKLYKAAWRTGARVKGEFFIWLDHGAGKSVSLPSCPRDRLDGERVQYLPRDQRKPYRVVFANRRLVCKATGMPVNTRNHVDTIYVLSPEWKLYVADKVGRIFHHTSFLSGGDVLCAGHLHVHNGKLDSISITSDHYKPTRENLELFKRFLHRHNVDLRHVRIM